MRALVFGGLKLVGAAVEIHGDLQKAKAFLKLFSRP
jgi:hypothetical protein